MDGEKAIEDIYNRAKEKMDIIVDIEQIASDGKGCIEIEVPKRQYAVSYKKLCLMACCLPVTGMHIWLLRICCIMRVQKSIGLERILRLVSRMV